MRAHATRLAAAALATAAGLTLAACGGSSDSGPGAYSPPATTASPTGSTSPAVAGGRSTVTLSADPGGALRFTTSTLTAEAGTVTVRMTNPSSSGTPHAIAIEGNGVDEDGITVEPGGVSIDTVALEPGTYRFYCPVPGHEAAGMKGTLTVT